MNNMIRYVPLRSRIFASRTLGICIAGLPLYRWLVLAVIHAAAGNAGADTREHLTARWHESDGCPDGAPCVFISQRQVWDGCPWAGTTLGTTAQGAINGITLGGVKETGHGR